MISENKIINKKSSILNSKSTLFLLSIMLNISSLIIIALSDSTEFRNKVNILSILCSVQFICSLYIFYSIEKKLLSLTSIFFIISNIFHIGQLILISFNINVEQMNYVAYIVDHQTFSKSVIYVFMCHMLYVYGVILNNIFGHTKKYNVCTDISETYNLYRLKKVGWVLLLIGIIPSLYIDINKLILFLHGAYSSAREFSISGYISIVASFAKYGSLILLIAYQKNKRICNIIVIASILYQCIPIYSGDRGGPFVFIVTLFFIYYKLVKKITYKSLILSLAFAYLSIVLIGVIGDTRSLYNRDIDTVIVMIEKNSGLNAIWRIIAEFGGTLLTVAYSITFFPEYAPIQFGTNYIVSVLYIIPNILNMFSLIIDKIYYIKRFPANYSMFMGGSYIGETYYSFNILGPFVVLVIGMVISKVSNKMNRFIIERNWVGLTYLLAIFSSVLWWNRDYFGSMIRQIVWTNCLIFFLLKLLRKRNST